MKIVIHQPNFLPWIGYFYKMGKADMFVFLDTVQYPRRSFVNRVKIKTPKGEEWLGIPVKSKGKYFQNISEVEIDDSRNWQKEIIKKIEFNYGRTKYFNFLFPELHEVLMKNWKYLSELNIELNKLLIKKLGINVKTEIASNYKFSGKSEELLINICKHFKADTYFSGRGASQYQNEIDFKKNGIKLEYSDFVSPEYPQNWGDFIPNLSIIDLIFNCGPDSLNILMRMPQN